MCIRIRKILFSRNSLPLIRGRLDAKGVGLILQVGLKDRIWVLMSTWALEDEAVVQGVREGAWAVLDAIVTQI